MATYTRYGDADTDGTFDGSAQRQTLVGKSGRDVVNYLYGEASSLTNAEGGHDVLIGGTGASGNYLYGDADTMTNSQGGHDVLAGGGGAPYNALYGDADTMINSQGGHDQLTGEAGARRNTLYGDALYMQENSQGGHDVLTGGANSNHNALYGDADTMTNSQGGHDRLIGGAGGTNRLFGDADTMIDSQGGHDVLTAGGVGSWNSLFGDNNLFGDAHNMTNSQGGHDVLTGGAGGANNFLYGDAQYYLSGLVTCGNDTLISGTGNDAMWGDIAASQSGTVQYAIGQGQIKTGQDLFVFSANNGEDTIHDFRQTDRDKIELKQMGVSSFDALTRWGYLAEVTDTDTGKTNTVITFGTNTITVLGVTGLIEADFLFT